MYGMMLPPSWPKLIKLYRHCIYHCSGQTLFVLDIVHSSTVCSGVLSKLECLLLVLVDPLQLPTSLHCLNMCSILVFASEANYNVLLKSLQTVLSILKPCNYWCFEMFAHSGSSVITRLSQLSMEPITA